MDLRMMSHLKLWEARRVLLHQEPALEKASSWAASSWHNAISERGTSRLPSRELMIAFLMMFLLLLG